MKHNLRPHFKKYRLLKCRYAPNEYYPDHKDGYSRISIVLQGNLTEKSYDQEVLVSELSLVIKSSEVLHQNNFGPEGANILSILFAHPDSSKLFSSLAPEYNWLYGYHSLPKVGKILSELLSCDCENEFESRLIQFLLSYKTVPRESLNSKPSWMPQVTKLIHEEFDRPIRTSSLAKHVAVHPVYLARKFRAIYGCTIHEYITQVRIANTLRTLTLSNDNFSQIACKNGFYDQSHFNRKFKECIGMNPGNFKKLATH